MSTDRRDLTALLRAFGTGEKEALDQLIPLVYDELRSIARARLNQLRPGDTLNTTGLVHEAYLRLVRLNPVNWQSRGHFFALASTLMRHLLLNYARHRSAQKRGGRAPHVEVQEDHLLIPDDHAERLVELDALLDRLQEEYPRAATILSHRYFGGLRNAEIAESMGISVSTVERELRFGRAWLSRAWHAEDG